MAKGGGCLPAYISPLAAMQAGGDALRKGEACRHSPLLPTPLAGNEAKRTGRGGPRVFGQGGGLLPPIRGPLYRRLLSVKEERKNEGHCGLLRKLV